MLLTFAQQISRMSPVAAAASNAIGTTSWPVLGFLNSTVVDLYFRQFNGHTQVNATDLRSLNYPTKAQLEKLGRRIADPGMQQEELDAVVEEKLF
jgi:hypothetical protein